MLSMHLPLARGLRICGCFGRQQCISFLLFSPQQVSLQFGQAAPPALHRLIIKGRPRRLHSMSAKRGTIDAYFARDPSSLQPKKAKSTKAHSPAQQEPVQAREDAPWDPIMSKRMATGQPSSEAAQPAGEDGNSGSAAAPSASGAPPQSNVLQGLMRAAAAGGQSGAPAARLTPEEMTAVAERCGPLHAGPC